MLTSLIAIILVIIGFVYKFFTFKQSRKRRKTLLLKIVKLKSVEKENKHYKVTTIYYDPNTQSETEYTFYNSSEILPKEFKIEIDDYDNITVYKQYKRHEILIPFFLFGIALLLFFI